MLKNSIFFRIYAGLIVLVAIVAIVAYLLVQVINYQRAQEYMESLSDGVIYAISEVVARQPTEQEKLNWISDASNLLQLYIGYVNKNEVHFSLTEQKRLRNEQAVVRYDANNGASEVYTAISNDPNRYLYLKLDKIGERQMRALPVFILENLVYHPGREKQRLAELRPRFSYPIDIIPIHALNLDSEQIGRLRQNQSIMIYRDSVTARGTTISIINRMPDSPTDVLVVGPIPTFNWMPFQLAAGITLFSLFLLSLGVYGLILPLERKIRQVRVGLNQVKQGVLSTRVQVKGRDEVSNLANTFNNMTEHIQRLIEAQRELTRAVSHELRTPVARVRFGMEMLAETDDYDSRLEQMEMIDKDIEALNSLIDEIMTYAKLEQGIPSLTFTQIRLVDVIEQVFNETQKLSTSKNKNIIIDVYDRDVVVEAEERYLHRVIQNLVGNALRYAENTIKVTGGIYSDGTAYLIVEDDGAGIPEKDRDRVFEAFARLDDSRTRASGGYGLGLSIVSRIAYWFGGQVKVEQSNTLGGAKFIVSWPAQRYKVKAVKTKSDLK